MPDVDVRRDGAVLAITLNRPDVLNALNASMHRGLAAALVEARDPAVRAVLLTGAGRGFCVGQDLQEFSAGAGDVTENLRRNYNANVLAIRALEKPVIAAVNGAAAGAGMSLALACDVRIASDAASFVPAFVNIGLVPDSGGTWFVRRLLGAGAAFEWLSTGRRVGAEEARTMGLVSEVVPAAEFEERMHEVAQYFADRPTRALWQTKRLLDAAETTTLAEQLELEALTQAELVGTPDFTEGVAAFREKREAAYTGQPEPPLHPVTLVVRDDLARWRLTVLLRYLLVLPHLVVLELWAFVVLPVAVVAWFAAIFSGRLPAGLHDWLARYVRYTVHVNAYLLLIADPYPRFRGWEDTYPVDLHVSPPEPQPRWATILRLPLAIPAFALGYVLSLAAEVTAVAGWFVSLAAGRLPRGMRDFMAYCLRYQAQTYAYVLLLTSRYPTLASGSGFQFEEG